MADTSLVFNILAKDNASKAFESAGKSAGKSGKAFEGAGKHFAAVGKLAATGLAAGVAIAGVALVKFVANAEESRKISQLTAQVIKTTGGVAKVTGGHVKSLATAISRKTGIDDEAIASSENLLLTFTNVRNETGKGNKVFDQATGLVQDMSAALGQDGKAGAIQLGKALNDPIKGVSALSEVGVAFTKQQTKQIKKLQESGDTLGAQKIILKELGKEFGGAAEAAATPMMKLKQTASEVGESIGTALLPMVDKAATFLSNKLPGAIAVTSKFFKTQIMPVLKRFGEFIGDTVIPAVKKLVNRVGPPLVAALKAGFGFIKTNVLPILESVATFIVTKVIPVVGTILKSALEGAKGAFKSVGEAIDKNRPQLEKLLGAFRTVATFIVDKVAPAIGPLLKVQFKILGTIISIAITAVGKLWTAFTTLSTIVLNAFGLIINGAANALGWIPGIGPKLKKAQAAFNKFRDSVNESLNGIKDQTVRVTVQTKTAGVVSTTDSRGESNAHGTRAVGGKTKKHKALGGPVMAGLAYTVGERGSETFVPAIDGQIMPHLAGGGGGGNVYVNITGVIGEAQVRQIRDVLDDFSRRRGGATLAPAR